MGLSSEVERAVLGAVLNNPDVITGIATLSPHDFFDVRHELIWKAILGLWSEDRPFDTVATLTALQHSGDADRVGGAPYLFDLMQAAALPAAVPAHVDTIRDSAARRRLNKAASQIQDLPENLSAVEALSYSQELLDGVLKVESDDVQTVGDTLDDTLEHIRRVQDGEVEEGLKTGLHDLDHIVGGFRGGQMIIVAARPGVGKSTLGVDFMRHAALHAQTPALLFSLEMSKHEVNERVLAAESGIRVESIRKAKLTDSDWGQLSGAYEKLVEAPIFVSDFAESSVMDIVAKTKMLVKKHNIGLVVIDYVQLLRSESKTVSREQEVAGYSRRFKLLAKSCDVPVVVIAQVNRNSEQRGEGSKLKPSDLRESGALEQDADIILLINRPDAGDPDHARAGEADIDVAKNRGGRTGTAVVATQMHLSRFANLRMDFND